MFRGSITALITPFKQGGAIDETAYQTLIEAQIAAGTDGLVPAGTTGESPALSHDEHRRVIELCIEAAHRRVPVIAGAGSNSTQEAIDLAQHAQKAGADAILSVTPYYNKPTQEGLFQHFKAIQDAAAIPLIIYNIPSRSGVDMSVETMARLAALPNVAGVKDSTADLTRPARTRTALGPEFCQLSGEDGTAVAFLAQGGVGCISVTANVAPALCAALQDSWAAGDFPQVAALRDRLTPLNDVLFCETNPAPVKYAVHLLGHGDGSLRLPMVTISEANQRKVEAVMQGLGLI